MRISDWSSDVCSSDLFRRPADIGDDAVRVESLPAQLDLDDVCRAAQALRWPEHRPFQAMRDHDAVGDGDAVHGGQTSLSRVNISVRTPATTMQVSFGVAQSRLTSRVV